MTVEYSGRSATLEPWTYCYDTGCVDGAPPRRPLDVGSPDQIEVTYPLPGWSFKASFTPAGEECGRSQQRTLEEVGDGRFLLRPAGFAGAYDVTLSGRGEGDLFVTFRWTTPVDGPLPRPRAYLGVVTDSDDAIISYGVEMSIRNLADDPERVRARVTVTARNGRSISFTPRMPRDSCPRDASLWWDGPAAKGHAAARLGEPPFTYEVDLRLDGRKYTGHGVWPDDEIRGSAPYVRLEFEPELPSLGP